MVPKKHSPKLKVLAGLMVLLVIAAVNSFAATGTINSSQRTSFSTIQATPFNAIAKLTPELAAIAEAAINENLEISSDSPGQMAAYFQKYQIRRMVPLHKDLFRWKRQTGKSESEYAEQIRQRNPRRAKRNKTTIEISEFSRTYVMEFEVKTSTEFEEMLTLLQKDSGFEYVEKEQVMTLQATPNDPYFSSRGSWQQSYDDLYGLKEIACPQAWELASGEQVVVAVIDSGVDLEHPDIAANLWTNSDEIPNNNHDDDNNGYIDDIRGWNYVDETNSPMDDYGHGTHVAGTIAAVGNNGIGVIGVAPGAKIMALRGMINTGIPMIQASKAIIYAVNNGADVINMSFGLEIESKFFEEAIKYAYENGVVLIAAAGNDTKDVNTTSPAGYHDVITVSALDPANKLADFSNFGREVDVAAPGVDILSLRATGTSAGDKVDNYYTRISGTSMAAPHVAGVAALILSRHPEFSTEQVRQAICATADSITGTTVQEQLGYGSGKVNAYNAVSLEAPLEVHLKKFSSSDAMKGWFPVYGTVNGANLSEYTLAYGVGDRPSEWISFAQGNTSVVEAKLGVLNTTMLPDGNYTLRLVARDTNGKTYTDYLDAKVRFAYFTYPAPPTSPGAAHLQRSGESLFISGRANRPSFKCFTLEWGEGLNPAEWYSTGVKLMGNGKTRVDNGRLAVWDSSVVPNKTGYYTLRLTVVNGGFSDVTTTCVYLEPDLLSKNWPQRLDSPPANQVAPVKDANGKTSLVLNLFDPYNEKAPAFCRYSHDGTLQDNLSFNRAFEGQAAVGNLDGQPGEEAVFVRDGKYIRIVKPDNTFVEFEPEANGLNFQKTALVIQDLEGDANPEILAVGSDLDHANSQALYAWDRRGNLAPGFSPIAITVQENSDIKPKVRFLAVDLDRDQKKELLVIHEEAPNASTLKLYYCNGQPRNWPVQPCFDKELITNLLAGDLDRDGEVEIVVTTKAQNTGKVYLLREDGSVKPGWPVSYDAQAIIDAGLADMNRDSADEIVIATTGKVMVLTINGQPLSAKWPFDPQSIRHFHRFSAGDINGDTFPEILITNTAAEVEELWAVDYQAKVVKTWKVPGIEGRKADLDQTEPVLGDFDNNGKIDVALNFRLLDGSNEQGGLALLTLDAAYNPQYLDWPMPFQDPQNTSQQKDLLWVLNRIGLDAAGYAIKPGLTANITVNGFYENGNTRNLTRVATFQIDDPAVATVDADGTIHAQAPGDAVLTVNCAGRTVTAQVKVETVAVTALRFEVTDYQLEKYAIQKVKLIASFADGSEADVCGLASYASSEAGVAAFGAPGVLSGVGVGSAELNASYGGKTASARVSVVPPTIKALKLDSSGYSIWAGLSQYIKTYAVYSEGVTELITDPIDYTILDSKIAEIDQSGKITAKSPGSTMILVWYGGKKAKTEITVEVAEWKIECNAVANNYTVPLGSTVEMKVTGTTLYGQTKDFTLMLDYILGDETIATVAGGVITGLKVGQTPFKFNFLDEGFVEGTITVVEP